MKVFMAKSMKGLCITCKRIRNCYYFHQSGPALLCSSYDKEDEE